MSGLRSTFLSPVSAIASVLVAILGPALGGCVPIAIGEAVHTISLVAGDVAEVASRIDAGKPVAAAQLPLACRITADAGAAARALATSGVLSASRSAALAKAADSAAALAASDLCRSPASDPAGTALQVVAAVAAIRDAARGSGLTASAVAAGMQP